MNIYWICILAMKDVDILSLGYFPASSPHVSSVGVLGDADGNPATFYQCKLDSDEQSKRCATFRLFKIGDIYIYIYIYIYILDELKRLVVHFGLIWNFVASRSGSSFRCNRYTRPGACSSKVKMRRTSPIVCGCEWCIRFYWVVDDKCDGVDSVKIACISGSHTNTCDPSDADQLVLTTTRASSYSNCTNHVFSEIMVRMGGSYSIDVQSMVKILRKGLPERKDVDRHMVYNVRLRARRRKLELEDKNVEVLAHYFDTLFIKNYKSNSDNYSKGESLLICFVSLLIIESDFFASYKA